MDGRLGWRVWSALGVVYLVWGSTYLAIRYVVRTVPPFLGGGLRFSAAGLVMLVLVLALRGPGAFRVSRAELGTAALVGTLMLAGGNGGVTIGEQRVPSGLAALLVACVPLWIVVLRTGLGDRPHRVTVLGVLLGLSGVAILLLPGGGSGAVSLGYPLLVVLASLSWATGSLLSVRRPLPRDPLVLATIEMLAGGAVMLAGSGARGEWSGFSVAQVSGQSWAALGYLLGFGSLLAFTAYVYLLGSAPVSLVATYAYVNPAIAVLLGTLIAGEQLALATVAGAVVIVLAVALVVTEESRATRRAVERPAAAEPVLLDTGAG
jgi:drug/metabolite transporter (DMT)-like permease